MYDGRPASWGWLTGVRSYVRWFDNKRWLINRFPFSFLFLRDAQKQNFLIIQNIDYNAQWGWWWGEGLEWWGCPGNLVQWISTMTRTTTTKRNNDGRISFVGTLSKWMDTNQTKPNHTKEKKDTKLSLFFQNVNEVWHIRKKTKIIVSLHSGNKKVFRTSMSITQHVMKLYNPSPSMFGLQDQRKKLLSFGRFFFFWATLWPAAT